MTDHEWHLRFAREFNQEVWQLLSRADRTTADDLRMIEAAHASLMHWRYAGTAVHQQRGHWLLSRVYAVVGDGAQALRHAQACMALTEGPDPGFKDFDRAYALEAMARALALCGDPACRRFLDLATQAGEQIAGHEDKRIFQGDLSQPPITLQPVAQTGPLLELQQLVATFTRSRGWTNEAKNVAMSVAIEAAEIMEHYQWTDTGERLPAEKLEEVALECADVLWYLLRLCETEGIDLEQALRRKMAINAGRFPVKN